MEQEQPSSSVSSVLPCRSSSRPRRADGTFQKKLGRPSNKCKGGKLSWVNRLVAAGKLEEAASYAARTKLNHPALQQTAAIAAIAAHVPLLPSADGGEGGDQAAGRENGDKIGRAHV